MLSQIDLFHSDPHNWLAAVFGIKIVIMSESNKIMLCWDNLISF